MRPLRRMDRCLDEITSCELLKNALYGVLATVDTTGQAHATPLSYAYAKENDTQCLYMHMALEGQKLDNIAHEPRVAFTIVENTNLLPKAFTIEYQSIMVFGIMTRVEDSTAKKQALKLITDKYSPEHAKAAETYINSSEHKIVIMRLAIDHISGKQFKK